MLRVVSELCTRITKKYTTSVLLKWSDMLPCCIKLSMYSLQLFLLSLIEQINEIDGILVLW